MSIVGKIQPAAKTARGPFQSSGDAACHRDATDTFRRSWHVGQITGIHSSSQELSPRRETGCGLSYLEFMNRTAARTSRRCISSSSPRRRRRAAVRTYVASSAC